MIRIGFSPFTSTLRHHATGQQAARSGKAAEADICRLLPFPRFCRLGPEHPKLEAVPKRLSRQEDRFTSWKEIAAYLDRDVRTVQRWELTRGLPVHRLPGSGRSPIHALKSELDAWWARTPARQESPTLLPMPARRVRRGLWLAVPLVAVAAVGAWILLPRSEAPAPIRVVPLTSLPGGESAPALSPDGRRLAFTWLPADSRNMDIYVVDLPDGTPRRITDNPAVDTFAEWSPEGQRLAYIRAAPGSSTYELRVADLRNGSDRKLLESDIPGTIASPPWVHIWTPDGEGLILSRPRQQKAPFGMVLLRLKTGIEHPLRRRLPGWSAKGRRPCRLMAAGWPSNAGPPPGRAICSLSI